MTPTEVYAPKLRAGAEWLAARLKPDGSFGKGTDDLNYYYKMPWGMAAGGLPWASSLVGDHLKGSFLLKDGDMRMSEALSKDQWTRLLYFYYEGWAVYGLQKVSRYDVTYRAMSFLARFQDRSSGGFYSNKDKGQMDILTTGLLGLCCLGSGELERGVRAGTFLASALNEQKDPGAFYNVVGANGSLVKEFPEEAKLYYVVDKTALDQWYFHLGIPIAFLVKLYEASGEERFLQTAEEYFVVCEQSREDVFKWNGTGKLSWGSSLLYKHLRDQKYRKAALSIMEGLFRAQQPEGGLLSLRSAYGSLEEQPLSDTIESTAECVALGSETVQALSSA